MRLDDFATQNAGAPQIGAQSRGPAFSRSAAIAIFLLAIAVPSGDDWSWEGFKMHREGTVARVVAATVGMVLAIVILASFLRPRLPTTLMLKGARLAYTEAKIPGETKFECLLDEIDSIEYEPWDGESGGTIRILVRGSISKLLFGDLDSKEIAAIAAEILPVWKAVIASK